MQARGLVDEEKAMYVQVVHLLHTMFTPDSIELFLLNPEVHDLEFLGEAQKSAKSAPRMADEPWTKMHMMHLDRFEKIFMSWYLRDKTRPASKIDVGASIQNMTPEDIFALRSCLGRWQRHWDPAAQDSEAHEKWAFEHFRESLLDTYERDSVMSYLDNADPDMPVLQPKNVSKDQGQTVAQDHVAKMAQLEEETWFRAWKDNTAFLLLYTGLKHRNASDPKLKWGNIGVMVIRHREVSTFEIYPQYCFKLSPTLGRWCYFQAADVQALQSLPGFEGQGFYFHLNHPVKWVRIAGVVVGVDEYPGRHIYTVDDGSGATIECVVRVAPRPQAEQLGGMDAAQAAERLRQAGEAAKAAADKVSIDATIDVGHVLQVQGLVKVFRDVKQVEATKVVHLLSTEQEVEFWTRLHRFRGDIIGRPWTLDRETLTYTLYASSSSLSHLDDVRSWLKCKR
ncbi:hypothetical protein P8C59_008852 [Phyllachora maydis]|uniref:CST complex subunit STN1 n=1 Tax=Phyllachora maydis TaxID=1825666 RepID=A0AAD9ICB3_9PEZI|nr:hypothetical protein P8C59_008852 [Phyllachora maydis]